MDFEQTDQEQVEQLQKWWRENWKALIGGLVLGLGGILGWDQYQLWQQDKAAHASEQFEAVAELVGKRGLAEAAAKAEQLVAKSPRSPYAAHAKLSVAKAAAEAEDWEQAAKHLEWVVDSAAQAELRTVATLRMAKVRWAQGQIDAALSLLKGNSDDAFAPAFAELRGDIERQKGNAQAARAAYQQALDSGVDYIDRAGLQRKLDDLPTNS